MAMVRKDSPENAVSPPQADKPSAEADFQEALREFFADAGEATFHSEEAATGPGPAVTRGTQEQREYLSFRLAGEDFAIPIEHIREIIKPPPITPVPRVPPVVLGVLSLRGTVVPILDLRRRLNLPDGPRERRNRVLIVRIEEEPIGFLVDEVRHVIRFRPEQIEPPPPVFGRGESEHLLGVGRYEGEMYTLLQINSLVSPETLGMTRPKEVRHG